jgi:penicillin-binding protein 1B
MLNDEQTTYDEGGPQEYTPRNYKDEYHGEVTAIYALAHSLNNATISLGAQVGFDNVAALARESGVKNARGTPSVSLGAYDATPLDMAGAYTVFANGGVYLTPWMLASVRTATGDVITDTTPVSKQVLDPRAAYLTTNLMEGVMNFGYGYEVRRRGFMAPAAGKTGTSHDAWFAGFTSNLLCIVWIGNDDYTDVKLAGATAAAPIWAEFMKKAVLLPQYSRRPKESRSSSSTRLPIYSATKRAHSAMKRRSCKAQRRPIPATTRPIIATYSRRYSDWETRPETSRQLSMGRAAIRHWLAARTPKRNPRIDPL